VLELVTSSYLSFYSPPSLTLVTIPNERGETFFGAAALFDWARVCPAEANDVEADERTADIARAPVRAKRPENRVKKDKREEKVTVRRLGLKI
jgi:hypothetical protein